MHCMHFIGLYGSINANKVADQLLRYSKEQGGNFSKNYDPTQINTYTKIKTRTIKTA